MKFLKILSIILVISLLSIPCFAINLESENLIDNIIKSFNEEPERWILRANGIYYFDKNYIKDARNSAFPDVANGCIVSISHTIFRGKHGYVVINKPAEIHVRGKDYDKIAKAIRQFMYIELHDGYGIRMPKKKKSPPVVKEGKVEIINGLKKL